MDKLRKIYSRGRILDYSLYEQLKELDGKCFPGCGNEFLKNRDWWVISVKNKIIAYCGSAYSMGICLFIRAWVHKDYRGNGIQKRMIKQRIKAAKNCKVIVTYTVPDNYASANSLISTGFRLFDPAYAYAGRGQMYFRKVLK